MSMPMKMRSYEIPSYVLNHFIIPFAEQCYLVSIEYNYANFNKLLVILLKDCEHVNGAIYLKLNDIINNLMRRYGISVVTPEWILQKTLFIINRVLQSYFYHRAEFSLAPPKR